MGYCPRGHGRQSEVLPQGVWQAEWGTAPGGLACRVGYCPRGHGVQGGVLPQEAWHTGWGTAPGGVAYIGWGYCPRGRGIQGAGPTHGWVECRVLPQGACHAGGVLPRPRGCDIQVPVCKLHEYRLPLLICANKQNLVQAHMY